jgi:hypothetical protein
MYLQKGVAKFIPWDIEGLALINKRESQQMCIVVPLLSSSFLYFPCFPYCVLLSSFEVPFSGTEPSFFEEAKRSPDPNFCVH